MAANFLIAVQISLIGMGLVFVAILMLWGLMAGLMRLTASREKEETPDTQTASEAEKAAVLQERKRTAAAVAVAYALAQAQSGQVHVFPLPPTAQVSAWQSVMRADALRRKGNARR